MKFSHSAADCIKAYKDLESKGPVTRDRYRKESGVPEPVWTYHFGTFAELKRQAGGAPALAATRIHTAVAKATAAKHYEPLNKERAEYADKYLRPTTNRYKTMIVASDLHDREIDPFYLRVLVDTCKRVQPEVISLGGDIFDLPEFGKYTVDPREWDAVGRIKFVHANILEPMRNSCPDAQIDLIEGNHECRLVKHLADFSPATRAILGDLHGMTLGDLFGLSKYEVNYVAKADLKSYTVRDHIKELENNYRVYWDSVMVHHFPHARNMGLPGVNGHHHAHVVWPMYNVHCGAYEWHQLGAGHKRKASYCEGEKWHNGFAIIHVDTLTKSVNIEYVPITDFAVVGGKFYTREPGEIIT